MSFDPSNDIPKDRTLFERLEKAVNKVPPMEPILLYRGDGKYMIDLIGQSSNDEITVPDFMSKTVSVNHAIDHSLSHKNKANPCLLMIYYPDKTFVYGTIY